MIGFLIALIQVLIVLCQIAGVIMAIILAIARAEQRKLKEKESVGLVPIPSQSSTGSIAVARLRL